MDLDNLTKDQFIHRLDKQLIELGYEFVDRYYNSHYRKHIVDGIYLIVDRYGFRNTCVYIHLPVIFRITTQQQIDNIQKAYDRLQVDQTIINQLKKEWGWK